jgi:Uma2 family endonuclease
MTIYPPHNSAVRRLARRVNRILGDDWVIQVQGPITLQDHSEPEPDLTIARGPEERFDDVNPGPADIALVVEVADTSLEEDRGPRLVIYARALLPIYWLVNLVDRQVEVYKSPRSGKNPTYRRRTDYQLRDCVPLILDGQDIATLPVREILPSP